MTEVVERSPVVENTGFREYCRNVVLFILGKVLKILIFS
jgi:hypothetical protein